MNFKGIILAGGKSERFGEDKALAPVNGVPMIQRTVNLLRELMLDPVVVTRPTKDYSFLKCPRVFDLISEAGPLGGLFTACTNFSDFSLLVLTCDMPAVTPALLRYLMQSHEEEDEVTILSEGNGFLHPFPGIYNSKLFSRMAERIAQDELSMLSFLQSLTRVKVVPSPFEDDLLLNVNYQTDLR